MAPRPKAVDLLEGSTLAALEESHGIKASMSRDRRKVSLNYSHLKAEAGDPISGQCRGLIIRPNQQLPEKDPKLALLKPGVEVVAWPLDRFYKYNDPAVTMPDLKDPELQIQEKLDGTMCLLYWDGLRKRWCVGTRAVPDADIRIASHVGATSHTFSSLFKLAAQSCLRVPFDDWTAGLQRRITYVLELTSPLNRVVVGYGEYRITLLAMRDLDSGLEISLGKAGALHAVQMPFRPIRWPAFSTIMQLVRAVNGYDAFDLEGAVILDSSFRRCKVKNKGWLIASRSKEILTASPRNAVEAVISGTADDITALLTPVMIDEIHDIKQAIARFFQDNDRVFSQMRKVAQGDRKIFAKLVTGSGRWSAALFRLTDPAVNGSTEEWLVGLHRSGKLNASTIDKLLDAIRPFRRL